MNSAISSYCGPYSSVDPDRRGLARRRHSGSPKKDRSRRQARPNSPEGESIDRIVDMALRMADNYGGGGGDGRGERETSKGNNYLRKGGSMEKYVTSEDRR